MISASILVVCAISLLACEPATPASARLGPFEDLPLTVIIDPSASFITEVIPVVQLRCQSTERSVFLNLDPGSHDDFPSISPRVQTRQTPTEFQLKLSLDTSYSAVAPGYFERSASHFCEAFARLYVSYPGASEIRSTVPGYADRLADSWFPTNLGRMHTQKENVDFSPAFFEALQGVYRIRCGVGGTIGTDNKKTYDTLWLDKQTPEGWESKGMSISRLERPCRMPAQSE